MCIRNSQVKFWRTTYYLGIEIEGLFCSQLPSSFRYQLFYLTLSHLAKILKLRLLNFLLFNYRKRRKIYWFDSWETGVVPDQEKCFEIGWLLCLIVYSSWYYLFTYHFCCWVERGRWMMRILIVAHMLWINALSLVSLIHTNFSFFLVKQS